MILKAIKAVAIGLVIATAAVAVLIFGTFIGGLLLFLGAIGFISGMIWFLWQAHFEHQAEISRREKRE